MTATRPAAHTDNDGKKNPRRMLRALLLMLLIFLLAGLVIFGWLVHTQSGLQFLLARSVALTDGRLQISVRSGTLAGPLHLDSLRWQDADLQLEASDVQLDWQPYALWWRHLHVHTLRAARVEIRSRASDAPAVLPAHLRLPLTLSLDRVQIDNLQISALAPAASVSSGAGASPNEMGRTAAADAGSAPLNFTALSGNWQARRRQHVLQLSAQWPQTADCAQCALQLSGQLQLATQAPFALQGELALVTPDNAGWLPAALRVSPLARASRWPLRLQGSLAEPELQFDWREGAQQLQATIGATPFAALPVQRLALQASDLDLARWLDGAPHTALALQLHSQPSPQTSATNVAQVSAASVPASTTPDASPAHEPASTPSIAPATTTSLALYLRLDNRDAGPLDTGRLPLARLDSDWLLRDEDGGYQLQLLAASLWPEQTQDGRQPAVQAEGRFGADGLRASLNLQALGLQSLHGAARPLAVDGQLQLLADSARQTLHGELRSAGIRLQLQAERQGERVQLDGSRLSGAAGELALAGYWQSGATPALDLQLHSRGLRPDRLWQMPPTRLGMQARLHWTPQPATAALDLQLYDSRFDGQPLAGGLALAWPGGQALRANGELRLGDNRLALAGGWGRAGEQLQLRLTAPDLQLAGLRLRGGAEAYLGGRPDQPQAGVQADISQLLVAGWQLDGLHIDAELPATSLDQPPAPALKLRLAGLQQLAASTSADAAGAESARTESVAATAPARANVPGREWLRQLDLQLSGPAAAQRLQATAVLDGAAATLRLDGALSGALNQPARWRWQGWLSRLDWQGPLALQLQQPAALSAAGSELTLADARLLADAGELHVQSLHVQMPDSQTRENRKLHTPAARWHSRGRLQHWPLRRWLPDTFAASDLLLSGAWDAGFDGQLRAQAHLQREAGDLRWQDGQLRAAGLDTLYLQLDADAQRLTASGALSATSLGELTVAASLPTAAALNLDASAPLAGALQARLDTPDWLGPLLWPGLHSSGRLLADLRLDGVAAEPQVHGEIRGEDLRLGLLASGMQLDQGRLLLQLDGQQVRLMHAGFRDAGSQRAPRASLRALAAGGLSGRGYFDWQRREGEINLDAERLGVLQLPRQWARISGQAGLRWRDGSAALSGTLRADGGAITLPPVSRPSLSEDVIIAGRERSASSIPLHISLDADLGPDFHFSGAGIDTRLTGQLQLRAQPGSPLRSQGSIETVDGLFDAYGQRLSIERGRLSFAGALDNPGLDVLAMRRNQPVPAGVAISGTARFPQVRLVSEPELPEPEKLSWLVLGKALAEVQTGDPALLMAAAGALFGGGEGGKLANLQRQLGLQIGVRKGALTGDSNGPRSRILDYSRNGDAGNEILTVAKSLADGVTLGFEQVLGTGENIIRLSWALSKRLSLEARSGEDNALDLFYTWRFGGRAPEPAPADQ